MVSNPNIEKMAKVLDIRQELYVSFPI